MSSEKKRMNLIYNKILITASLLLFFVGAQAQVSTRKLEAIYMYNFTKYINWQNTGGEGHTIGVWEEEDVASELEANLKNKGGISVKVVKTMAEAKKCEIIYLPKTKSGQLNEIMSSAGNDVLIVTEEDLASKGASVSFVLDGSKLRFKINQGALDKAGLQASSSLLSLAILL